MNCIVCTQTGKADRAAVALCPHCKAGLCLDHVHETAKSADPGGMKLACSHHTWDRS